MLMAVKGKTEHFYASDEIYLTLQPLQHISTLEQTHINIALNMKTIFV